MISMRKIIQIQALRFEDTNSDDGGRIQETEIIALCDDGSIWIRIRALDGEWVQLENIPQD